MKFNLKESWENFLLKVKFLWERLLHQEVSPSQIGMGFALGVFVSFLPIFPAQTLISLLLAFLFRSNKVAVLTGLHFHLLIFPAIPFIFISEFKIGRYLLQTHGRIRIEADSPVSPMSLAEKGLDVLKATFLGAFVLGIPLAIVSYFLVKSLARRWQKIKFQQGNKPASQ